MANTKGTRMTYRCSFCGKSQDQVQRLIAGPGGVYICDECIDLCREIIEEEQTSVTPKTRTPTSKVPTPKKIYEQLNAYVIGQEKAKKTLSVAAEKLKKNINTGMQIDDVELSKSNILLIGPSGCGKTLLAQTLAKILDVPFCIADATALTEAGYVGEDVENILLRLIQMADFDIARPVRGIVYIVEIAKIARTADNPSISRDVSGEGVQQALLKIIESTIANVPPQGGRKHPHQDLIQINTSNILFICGGAFEGLDKIIEQRLGSHKTMGFKAVEETPEMSNTALAQLNPDDLLKFGLIPEFVGRLPVSVSLDNLDRTALMRILTEPKNALVKQYQKLFHLDRAELVFTDEALEATADCALKQKTGARGLRTVIEDVLLDVMFDIPSRSDIKKVIIEADTIVNHAPARLITRGEARAVELEDESA